MPRLYVGGPCATRERKLDREALAALDASARIDDVGTVVDGRVGTAVRLAGLAALVEPTAAARFVHVASADGGFTANIPLEQALGGGLVLYEHGGAALPARFGGPFRLLFTDSEDCSVNVKFLRSIEFVSNRGAHTAHCADDG